MSVLIVGSVALDTIRTPLGACRKVLGGSAVFSAVSASYFSPVNLVAVVGKDFPVEYVSLMKDKGIDTEGLETADGDTFCWEGEYSGDFGDPRTIATHLNVFAAFQPRIPARYRNSKFLFLANIDPELQEKVLTQVNRPKLVLCDTMNFWINNKRKELLRLLKKVDIFLLNSMEARMLSGEHNLALAAKKLLKSGPKKIIIKKGEHGAIMFSKDSTFTVPAYILDSVYDPTGAGDTFAGGLIGYLAKCGKVNNDTLRKAIVYGSIMATFAVEDFSVRKLALISRKEIQRRYKLFCRLTKF